jgi:hypothetical protein
MMRSSLPLFGNLALEVLHHRIGCITAQLDPLLRQIGTKAYRFPCLQAVTMSDLRASLAGVTGVGLAVGASSDTRRRMNFGPSSATTFFRRGGRL